MDLVPRECEEWFRRKLGGEPIPITGTVTVGYEYNRCVGPRNVYARVVLSIRYSKTFSFQSNANWPGGNHDDLVLDGILDALFGWQPEMLVANFELVEVGYDPIHSEPIAYYWAAKRIVESVLGEMCQWSPRD